MVDIDPRLQREWEEEERQREEQLAAGQQTSRRAEQYGKEQAKRFAKSAGKKAGRAVGKAAGQAAKAAGRAVAQGIAAVAAAAAPYVLPVLLGILAVIAVILVILVVIAYICSSQSWYGTAARSAAALGSYLGILDSNYCKALEPVSSTFNNALCDLTPEQLAVEYNTPTTPTNDPQLNQLIAYVEGVAGPMVTFTYDGTYPLCNITRGIPRCSQCSHTTFSCHYGGETGSTGSLAVDFAVTGARGVEVLQATAASGIPVKRATCENSSGVAVPCSDVGATHVHISLASCDRDNGPINTQ